MFKALAVALLISTTTASAETSVEVAAAVGSGKKETGTLSLLDRDARPTDLQTRRIVTEWRRLRSGQGSFDDAVRFLEDHSDWPGLRLLRRKSEAKLPIGRRSDDVIGFFSEETPQTGHGAASRHREGAG